jgi:hypothetical protein
MPKPDPSITADLLTSLPTKKSDLHQDGLAGQKEHTAQRGPQPVKPKVSPRSAEKAAAVQGHTRSSNRGK